MTTTRTQTTSKDAPRIYVACLAAYNAGTLHGHWIDADQSPEDLHVAIQQMLTDSPELVAEDWAIHDYEGFGAAVLSECESLETVAELAKLIIEHGPLASEVFTHLGDLEEAKQALQDRYQGAYDSLTDWAEQLLEDTGELSALPEQLRVYFDYEHYARDSELSGDIFSVETNDGLVHVFWSA